MRVRCDVEQAGNQERGKISVAARDVEGGGRVLAKAGASGSLPVLEMASTDARACCAIQQRRAGQAGDEAPVAWKVWLPPCFSQPSLFLLATAGPT